MLRQFRCGQALMAWRDTFTRAIWLAFDFAAHVAVDRVSGEIPKAGIRDTYWNPAAFAHPLIDAAMREALAGPLCSALHHGLRHLRSLGCSSDLLEAQLTAAVKTAIGPTVLALPRPDEEEDQIPPWLFDLDTSWQTRAVQLGIAGATAAIIAPEALIGVIGYGAATLAKPLFAYRIGSAVDARVREVWVGNSDGSPGAMAVILAAVDRVTFNSQGEKS